jgi:hypothetical protein
VSAVFEHTGLPIRPLVIEMTDDGGSSSPAANTPISFLSIKLLLFKIDGLAKTFHQEERR